MFHGTGVPIQSKGYEMARLVYTGRKLRKKRLRNSSQMIALVFLGIILTGTLLLCLPFASRSGEACSPLTALFTATSSTCVTGLVLADTWSQWSGFGQAVILFLIEIGGLGFMSMASVFIFGIKKKMSMQQQDVIAQSIGSDGIGDTVRIQKNVIKGSLAVEGAGALILTLRFLPEFGFLKSLELGVFHSISAYCNAGFDIFGFRSPGSSVEMFGTDPVVLITLALLIITGGIGFLVWDDIFRKKSPRRWTVYSKLVIITTGILIVSGAVLIYIFEWNNPGTIGNMTTPQKFLAGFFQSVTTRTAGFAGFDQGALTDAGKAVSIVLMMIGGSSGSTAGGLKTVTFIVIILFMVSRIRGKESVHIFRRTIQREHVTNALTIFCIMSGLAIIGSTVLCATSGVALSDAIYECVSALATVGLTTGITPALSVPSQLIIILFMYFGRVGVLTISLGFLRNRQSELEYEYAKTNLLIG